MALKFKIWSAAQGHKSRYPIKTVLIKQPRPQIRLGLQDQFILAMIYALFYFGSRRTLIQVVRNQKVSIFLQVDIIICLKKKRRMGKYRMKNGANVSEQVIEGFGVLFVKPCDGP